MSDGRMTEQVFVQMMKDIFQGRDNIRLVKAKEAIEVHLDSLADELEPEELLQYQIDEELYRDIDWKLVFNCDIKLRIDANLHLRRAHFKGKLDYFTNQSRVYKELRIEACNFDKDVIIWSDTNKPIDMQQLVIEKESVFNNLEIKNMRFRGVRLKKSTFRSPMSTDLFQCQNLTANGCQFHKALKIKSTYNRTFAFNECKFLELPDVSSFKGVSDPAALRFNHSDWNFSKQSKKTLLIDLKGLNEQKRKSQLTSKLETLTYLRNVYEEKKQAYETRHFQRLINYVYQSQGSFTHKERIALWWAHISNDFGTNYVRGICFALTIGILFYLALLGLLSAAGRIEFDTSNSLATVGHFFDLINVTKWKYDFFELGNDHIVNITVYISRIFIGYGIYQTISAFRIITKM